MVTVTSSSTFPALDTNSVADMGCMSSEDNVSLSSCNEALKETNSATWAMMLLLSEGKNALKKSGNVSPTPCTEVTSASIVTFRSVASDESLRIMTWISIESPAAIVADSGPDATNPSPS